MTGTLLNVVMVLCGAGLRVLLGKRLPEKVRTTALVALGLVVVLIGLQMAFKTQNVLVLLASLVGGGVLGAWLGVEEGLERLGLMVEERLGRRAGADEGASPPHGPRSRFAEAFVTSSLVFCVGPMTIVGSIQDRLSGDFGTLAVKSVLDFFGAIAFASTLGPGVFLSAPTVLVYQGGLTLAASLARGVLTDPVVAEMTAAGGLMVAGVGLRLLEVRRCRWATCCPPWPSPLFWPLLSARV